MQLEIIGLWVGQAKCGTCDRRIYSRETVLPRRACRSVHAREKFDLASLAHGKTRCLAFTLENDKIRVLQGHVIGIVSPLLCTHET